MMTITKLQIEKIKNAWYGDRHTDADVGTLFDYIEQLEAQMANMMTVNEFNINAIKGSAGMVHTQGVNSGDQGKGEN